MPALPGDLFPALLYQDKFLVCIHKPAGLLSIPDGYDRQAAHIAQLLAADLGKLWIVHRLDRETSGVVILARSAAVHRELNRQFEQRSVQKVYHALASGQPAWDSVVVDLPLRINGDRKHRTVISALLGKPASTDFKILQRLGSACRIEARPHTGYTHQIRAHLAAIGCPILGDALYTRPNFEPILPPGAAPLRELPISRVALHALSITFRHPITQAFIRIEDPLPPDFQRALDVLSH